MKTAFTESQFKTIVKMAIEKGITIGKAGGSSFPGFKKTDSELASMHAPSFLVDIESLFGSENATK